MPHAKAPQGVKIALSYWVDTSNHLRLLRGGRPFVVWHGKGETTPTTFASLPSVMRTRRGITPLEETSRQAHQAGGLAFHNHHPSCEASLNQSLASMSA
jgi:hypothetical protein